MTKAAYTPNREGAAVLERALQLVQSVPYQVTARWLFYRLLGDVYSDKGDYKNKFLPLVTRARKAFYGGWAPDTLADDTRSAIFRGFGYVDAQDWLKRDVCSQVCTLDKWEAQAYYCEVWFEAAAMRSQFEHYTQHVTLRPFRGDPSLDYKWATAKHIESMGRCYPGKPIVILYFGDLDPKGLKIPESAVDDIREWCAVPFSYLRCGLNPGDERRFNLPENFDKPGTYQWEALSDEHARTLILGNLEQYMSLDAIEKIEAEEQRISERFQQEVTALLDRWTAL